MATPSKPSEVKRITLKFWAAIPWSITKRSSCGLNRFVAVTMSRLRKAPSVVPQYFHKLRKARQRSFIETLLHGDTASPEQDVMYMCCHSTRISSNPLVVNEEVLLSFALTQ